MPSITQAWRTIGQRFTACSSTQPEKAAAPLLAWEHWSGDTIAPDHAQRQRLFNTIVGDPGPLRTKSRKEQRLTKLRTLDACNNQLTSLPELPAKLKILYANNNQLTNLPELPAQLRTLFAGNNQLTSLPELPAQLHTLDASNNQLTNLPELPAQLQELDASNNQLTSLPELPAQLQELDASNNQLTNLPELPAQLQELDASNNQLTNLPELPAQLQMLLADSNQLTSLPELPAQLKILYASNNQLTNLPELPAQLQTLLADSNQLTSLPELPAQLQTLDARNNQFRVIPPQLLQKNLKAEVDLRNNPIPPEHMNELMLEIRRQRGLGEQTPTIIFDEELRNNPHDLGGLTDTNVHNRRLVGVFQAQLDKLIERYPDLMSSQTPFDFELLHTTLLKDLQTCAGRHPELNSSEFGGRSIAELAKEAIQSMCEQGKQGRTDTDFHQSAGHVLAYVHRYIKDGPPDHQDAGLVQFFRHLSYARGNNEQTQLYCPTRHAEEALTALQSAYGTHAGVPFEQARDLMQKLGTDVLLPLLEAPASTSATVQDVFKQRFRKALHEHPNITQEQITRYLNDFVFPHWETYCDVVRGVG